MSSFWTPGSRRGRGGAPSTIVEGALSPVAQLERLATWQACEHFEELATAVLDSLLDVATVFARQEQPGGPPTQVLRSTLYMRSGTAYGAVISSQRVPIEEQDALLSSASMWQWVHRSRSPMWMDTTMATLATFGEEGEVIEFDEILQDEEVLSKQSIQRGGGVRRSSLLLLTERDATHILILPVHGPRAEVLGMVTLETSCEAHVGLPGLWENEEEHVSGLMCMLCLAAPLLIHSLAARQDMATDLAPGSEALRDEWLPVVGETMRRRLGVLEAFARQEETLLIMGETGVGKSRLAKWCHERSSRAGQHFEVVDLGAVPESMQIASIMGWKKGAFTGAIKDVEGALGRAEGGTLFIDEVDKLSLETQASLLSVLETRRYRELGSGSAMRLADVRIIVGTNANLLELIEEGSFREDLYYRICVLPVEVLPLRKRRDEIAPWARVMLDRAWRSLHGEQRSAPPAPTLSEEAARQLRDQPWHGNLRELDNVMRRVMALCFSESVTGASAATSAPRVRVELVRQALEMGSAEGRAEKKTASSTHKAVSASTPDALLAAMRDASRHYIDLARASIEQGSADGLSVDLLDAIKAMAYQQAFEVETDPSMSLTLLGKKKLLKHRNYRRAMTRELEKLAALEAFLDDLT